MRNKRKLIYVILTVLFLASLGFVNFGSYSSEQLKNYNGGYGTFDMKSYDTSTVYHVLDTMEPQGFGIYEKYFIGDSVFSVLYCIIQILLLSFAYRWCKSEVLRRSLYVVPIIRCICDLTENAILNYILLTYPEKHADLIRLSATITFVKLKLISLWLLLFFIGIVIKIILAKKKPKQ